MDATKVIHDSIEIFIGGTAGPFDANVAITEFYTKHLVKSQRTGTSTVTAFNTGSPIQVTGEFLESDRAEIARLAGITGASVQPQLAVGTKMPVHAIRLHPKAAADNTQDIVIPIASFGVFSRVASTGEGPARFAVTIDGHIDPSTGVVWQLGYTAP